jgi:6-phosphogluconate dehydrogenase
MVSKSQFTIAPPIKWTTLSRAGPKASKSGGCYTLEELVANLSRPRKVMALVKAGQAVDQLIEQLVPLLEPGDIIIDGGSSHFPDTIRRTASVESKGLLYIGTGVSGGGRRRVAGAIHHARRFTRCLGTCEGHLSKNRRQNG